MKILSATNPIEYQLERKRSNITLQEFYWQCKTDLKRRFSRDIEDWIEYAEWSNPTYPEEFHRTEHENEDGTQTEIYKFQPYDVNMYLQGIYNFIMEFEFDTDKKGHGYMYVVEYKK